MRRIPLLPTALIAATVLVLAAFLGIVLQNGGQMRSLRDETRRVEHTLEVQRELDAVLLNATEADSAARGFLLNPADEPANEYRVSVDDLRQRMARLGELTRDNAEQQQRLGRLEASLSTRLDALARVMAARRTGTIDQSLAVARSVDSGRGRVESRQIAEEMGRAEERLLESRRSLAAIAYRQAVNGRVGSGIVSAVLLIGVVGLALAQARSRQKREAALIASEKRARDAVAREQEARAEAEQANRLKDEFLAVLSHELRTPLNAVLGWTQILQAAGPTEPTIVRALGSIKRNAEAQQRLIEDLLDVSRIVTGKFPLERRPFELRTSVAAAVEAVRPTADAKQLRLHVALDPEVPVNGDPDRLQQVATNVLANAVKFTPSDGEIEVKLVADGATMRLTIRDTGDGIPPDLLPYIFDRFRQGDGSSTRAHGGLGLGLAIAKHIVEAHGGSIEARSDGKGKGSIFSVRLPVDMNHAPDIH